MPVFRVIVVRTQEWDILIEAKDKVQAKQQAHDSIAATPAYFTPKTTTITVQHAELYPFKNKE